MTLERDIPSEVGPLCESYSADTAAEDRIADRLEQLYGRPNDCGLLIVPSVTAPTFAAGTSYRDLKGGAPAQT